MYSKVLCILLLMYVLGVCPPPSIIVEAGELAVEAEVNEWLALNLCSALF